MGATFNTYYLHNSLDFLERDAGVYYTLPPAQPTHKKTNGQQNRPTISDTYTTRSNCKLP